MTATAENSGLTVRVAEVEECQALTALMLRSSAYGGRYRSMIENYPVTDTMIGNGEVWVAEQEGRIVAFYRLDIANADLDLMFVEDSEQGKGLGRQVFAHLKAFAASCGIEHVTIVAHPPAADFYRRLGAIDVGMSKAKSTDRWDRPILRLATAS